MQLNKFEQQPFTVAVNDVKVGEIAPSDYERLRRAVYRDPRVWARWGGAGLSVLYRNAARLTYIIPMTTVWLLIMCAVFTPGVFTDATAAILKDPSQAAACVATLMRVSVLCAIVGWAWRVMWRPLGDEDSVFRQELSRRIRRAVKCPAEGSVSVFSVAAGSMRDFAEASQEDIHLYL